MARRKSRSRRKRGRKPLSCWTFFLRLLVVVLALDFILLARQFGIFTSIFEWVVSLLAAVWSLVPLH
ncbi:MAG: hypothetical protein WCO52_05010 [bacterium]